jgi:hypothetical protein
MFRDAPLQLAALAIASPRANAVGAVRLVLGHDALGLELVGVAAFTQGFAPAAQLGSATLRVPYTAVRAFVRVGHVLHLALDPKHVTPFNRFALVHFTDDAPSSLLAVHRARGAARALAWLLPIPLAAIGVAAAPARLVSGAVGLSAVAVVVLVASFLITRAIADAIAWGGPRSDRYRAAFEAELSRRLGLAPAAQLAPPAPVSSTSYARPIYALAAALVVSLAIYGASALFTGGARGPLAQDAPPPAPPPPMDTARAGIAEQARMRVPTIAPPPVEIDALPPCVCDRAASPLWKQGTPRLAVLTFAHADDGALPIAPSTGRAPRFSFEVAIVNNTAKPMRDVRVTFTFARRSKAGKRLGATDRGLFWGGELAPGHAAHWHVAAPGTELTLDTSEPGDLDASDVASAAPPEALLELSRSRFRALRLHAARMLAYERDARVDTALREIGAPTAAEAPLVQAIARAAAPIIACDLAREGDRLSACLFNGATHPARDLVVGSSDAPGWSAPLGRGLPVHEGRRVELDAPSLEDPPALIESLDAVERVER